MMSFVATRIGCTGSSLALAVAFAGAVLVTPLAPALAQSEKGHPEDLLEEGTRKILKAFELFIMTIPQYEMPEVLPNGDIILRRKNPPPGKGKKVPEDKAAPDGSVKTKT